jgi:pyruvate formate lyase activating enzyme
MAGEWLTVEDLVRRIERDRVFYEESGGGVTLSGGEPLSQAGFTEDLLRACRGRDIHTVLDTCGYAPPDVFCRIAEHVDLFLFDVKVIDRDLHRESTGAENDLILANLRWLAKTKRQVIVRVPVIPGYTDGEANLRSISEFTRTLGLKRVDLLPYHRIAADKYRRLRVDYRMGDFAPPASERMNSIADSFARQGFGVRIGG